MTDVIWIECYEIAVDAVLALPVTYAEPVCDAINSKQVRIVTEDEAAKINERFASLEDFDAKGFLRERLDARWRMINEWREQKAK